MPMGAVSAFTTGNYHCKPLMTDVIVIRKNKNKVKKDDTSAKVYDPPSLCPISGTSFVHQQKGPLDTSNIHSNHKEKKHKFTEKKAFIRQGQDLDKSQCSEPLQFCSNATKNSFCI